uniref:PDZ domain-containing protein n=1 Tax=Ditylenchus dipsaci TaxID=166011 RepID=A0A915E1Q0_9BILA
MTSSNCAYGHEPGKPLQCLSLAVELHKEQLTDVNGQPAYKYPDTGIYITQVEPDSPADKAGLKQHDKLLRVNGTDFTMVTHEKAVKYIRKDVVLNILLTRPEIAF